MYFTTIKKSKLDEDLRVYVVAPLITVSFDKTHPLKIYAPGIIIGKQPLLPPRVTDRLNKIEHMKTIKKRKAFIIIHV